MAKILKRDVDRACTEYANCVTRWGEHNLATVRALGIYLDRRNAWEAQTGRNYGAPRRGNRS